MSISNLIRSAFCSIKARKVRVFLTMLGIIIGISSVVTILSVGNGLKEQVNNMMSETNSNKYTISFTPDNYNDINEEIFEYFTQNDINEISRIDGVNKVSKNENSLGGIFSFMEVSFFDKKTYLNLSPYDGIELDVSYGREFKKEEESEKLIILGKTVAVELFDSPEDALGKGVIVENEVYEVIGITKKVSNGLLPTEYSYVSKNNLQEVASQDVISSLDLYINPGDDIDKIFEQVRIILSNNHAELEGEYVLEDPQKATEAFEKIIDGLTAFIACISGISLIVGGIGVMNIMYVSVVERKREIGIRRAIGAKPKTIMKQFLFEAVIITCSGGVVGILQGYIFSKIINIFLPFDTVITVGNFIVATSISVIIGLIFGVVPAFNAGKLDPIKAIYQ